MSDNKISKALKIVGFAIIVVGIIASIIIGVNNDKLLSVSIGGIIGSIISGLVFIGFSEIIDLLQQNVDYQYKIIRKLEEKPSNIVTSNNHLIQTPSIEKAANPKPPVKHLFRCSSCGKMIETYPCSNCGYQSN